MSVRLSAGATGLLAGGIVLLLVPEPAGAIPPFARRYETSCTTCHQGHYPRLNAYGRQFRDNGYQIPDGAEELVRATRSVELSSPDESLSIFKEVPLSMRAEVFNVVPTAPEEQQRSQLETSVYSFIIGGGSLGEDLSYYFTWTPFPDPGLHQARIGYHNIGAKALGEGTLNIRAGSLFLLDFQRPGHRFLANSPNPATAMVIGENAFNLEDAALGVQAYGRPGWGPFHYELAVVNGDAGGEGNLERDNWKDVFSRVSLTAFQYTDHEVTPGVFAYVGRSEFETELGDLSLAQRDDFWMLGGDLEIDVGMVNLSGMAFRRRHADPTLDGGPIAVDAGRGQVLWVAHPRFVTTARYEHVSSSDDPSLDARFLTAHLTGIVHTNALVSAVWRHDLQAFDASSASVVLDVAF